MIKRQILGLLLGLTSLARAQPAGYVSPVLEEYIHYGIANNLALKQEQMEVGKAFQALQQAKALFYPKLAFEPMYSLAVGGRRLAFPVGDLLNPAYKALNELTGANQFPTNVPNVNELLAPHNFHDTKVAFRYAFFNPEAKYNYLVHKNLLSAEDARVEVVENELRYAIAEAYYQYLRAGEALRIFEDSRLVLDELVRLNTRLAGNNVLTKDAVLAAEYELSALEYQQTEAVRNKKVAASYFNFLLNRALSDSIQVDSMLVKDASTAGEPEPLALAVKAGTTRRPELKQLDYSLEAALQAVRLHEKAAALPVLYIGGNTGFQGFGYTFKNQAYLVTQIGLQWDLFKGFDRRSRLREARIRSDQLQTKRTEAERQVELQVTRAWYDLEAAAEGLKTAASGVRKARSSFQIIDSRYRNRQVLLVEYLKAQNDVQTALMRQALARYDVWMRRAHLQRVTAGF